VENAMRAHCLLPVLAVLLATSWVLPATAQETPAVQVAAMPKFLFVVERNESMLTRWDGNPDQPTRWDVTVDALIGAVNSAPAGTEFALLTTDRHVDGWYAVNAFEEPDLQLARSLIAAPLKFSNSRDIGSALYGAARDYLHVRPGDGDDEWSQPPFDEPCTTIEVIVLGDGIGDAGDDRPHDVYFTGDVGPGDDDDSLAESGYTLLDDAAWYAANHDLAHHMSGAQTVRVHTILLDGDGGTTADALFASAASVSGGLYTRAETPADVSLGISLAMTDAMQSVLDVSTAVTSVVGHRMFRTWTEIVSPDGSGSPLYRGHIEAFQVANQPSDPAFGEIREPRLWDAAELLAQRRADPREYNSYARPGQDPALHSRTLYTNPAMGTTIVPRRLVPFDAGRAQELGPLMLPTYGESQLGVYGCPDHHPDDLDRNCVVDVRDAQLAIDFLRGVPAAAFAGSGDATGRTRGSWRVGGMFLSTPAFSDTRSRIFTDDPALVAYQQRLAEQDAVLFVTSNDGFLHAFNVPFLDRDADGWEDMAGDPTGGWELWGYIPRHLLAHDSRYHDDLHSALNLMRDGESHLHDGSVNLADIWMDGVPNRLDAECAGAELDGVIDADGCEFHRILVASLGQGSRYHYALDVTNPAEPRFLWEWLGDTDGWRKGMGTGTPIIASVFDAQTGKDVTVAIWSGGTHDVDDNVPERPRWPVPSERQGNVPGIGARWYMVDLSDPGNQRFSPVGYRIDETLSDHTRDANDPRYLVSDPSAGLFGTPAAVDYDSDGNVDALYIGSRHGALYKVLIDHGALSASTMESVGAGGNTCVLREPAEIPAGDVHDHLSVYYRPSVSRDRSGRIRVSWGTGWPGNMAEPYETGYMYSVTDGEYAGAEWSCQAAVSSSCGVLLDPMQLEPGEKLVGEVLTHAGRLLFTTYVADNAAGGPACGVGHTRVYALDLDDCSAGFVEGRDWGPEAFPVTNARYVEVAGIPSKMSFANHGIYLSVAAGDGTLQAIGPIRPEPPGADMDRVAYTNWRHVL